jgi:hypothetical protein
MADGAEIQAVHLASRGIYGSRRVHAELTLGLAITVGHGAVEMLMQRSGIKGLPFDGPDADSAAWRSGRVTTGLTGCLRAFYPAMYLRVSGPLIRLRTMGWVASRVAVAKGAAGT